MAQGSTTSQLAATYELAFLEGLHWKASAALFDKADIVVSPHGAQVWHPPAAHDVMLLRRLGGGALTSVQAVSQGWLLAAPTEHDAPDGPCPCAAQPCTGCLAAGQDMCCRGSADGPALPGGHG